MGINTGLKKKITNEEEAPDRCLICYGYIKSSSSDKSSLTVLVKQLDSVFILRKLLEIPPENLQTNLMTWGNPETWVSVCSKCDKMIERAKRIHYEIVKTSERFYKVKNQVIEAIRKSVLKQEKAQTNDLWKYPKRFITDQSRNFVSIHDYGNLSDPFILGDKRASQLAQKYEASTSNHEDSVTVKTEIDEDSVSFENFLDFDDGQFSNSEINFEETGLEKDNYTKTLDVRTQDDIITFVSIDNMPQDVRFCKICEVNFVSQMFEKHENFHKERSNELNELGTEDDIYSFSQPTQTDDESQTGDNVEKAHNSKVFKCFKCPRKFHCPNELSNHQNLHKVSPFHCYICLSVHKNRHNLRFHLWKNHPSTRTREYCSKRRKRNVEAEANFESETKKEKPSSYIQRSNHNCIVCGNALQNRSELLKHLAKYHRDTYLEYKRKSNLLLSTSSESAIGDFEYRCSVCENVFENRRSLLLHLGKYHRDNYLDYKRKSDLLLSGSPKSSEEKNSLELLQEGIEVEDTLKQHHISDSDTKSEKINDDTDWNPGEASDSIDSQSQDSLLRKSRPRSRKRCQQYKCPACNFFEFKIEEIEKLLSHWEQCKGIKEDINEENAGKVLICPICKTCDFSCTEQMEFCEHTLACKENSTDSQHIPLKCRIFCCSICPFKTYFKFNDFIQHFLEHKRNIYKCTKCPKRYRVTSSMHSHWKSHHRDAMKHVQPFNRFARVMLVPELCWWCHFCNKKFTNEDNRDSHIADAHALEVQKPHTCQECLKAYIDEQELKYHEVTTHALDSATKSISCDVCKQRFSTEMQLRNHRMRKHRLDLLVCDICGTECNSQFTFRTHMQLHDDVRAFVCQQCGKSFTCRQYLTNHTYKEHAPRDAKVNPLMCQFCEKVFHNKSYLNEHIATIHERQFKMHCHICNAGVQNNTQMKRHLARKHKIGELKRFHCTFEGCNRHYHCQSSLQSHMNTHTGNPQYKCQYCGKGFFNKKDVGRHELIHTNAESRPYVCHICAKSFPVRNYLYIHMKSHKKENKE